MPRPRGGPGGDPARSLGTVGCPVFAAEIGAGAEVLARGAEHDDAAGRIVVEGPVRVGERSDHRNVEEIVRRSPQLDRGHVAR
jgi:hypothetical protein